MTAQALAQTSGYAKRNVHEALAGLTDAQVLIAFTVGGEQRYTIEKEIWAALLQSSSHVLPSHRDWPQLFSALRTILCWSNEKVTTDASDYLLASSARQLLDALRPTLSFVGVGQRSATAEQATAELKRVTDALLSALDVGPLAYPTHA
jgi:hypothetical protein